MYLNSCCDIRQLTGLLNQCMIYCSKAVSACWSFKIPVGGVYADKIT